MRNFIYLFIGNVVGLSAATWLLSGLHVTAGTDWATTALNYALVAVVITILNLFIRPIIRFFSLPLYLLTLGLFSLVVNAMIIGLAAWLMPPLWVDGFWTAVFAGLIISIITSIIAALLPRPEARR